MGGSLIVGEICLLSKVKILFDLDISRSFYTGDLFVLKIQFFLDFLLTPVGDCLQDE